MFNPDDFLRFTDDPIEVSIESSSQESAQLDPGLYFLMGDQICYWRQGTTGGTADTNDKRLPADFAWPLRVTGNDDDYIQVIRSSTDGTLQIIPAGRTQQR